ncbi:MAG: TadE/TadG family type IV pilus assembly protein [Candidatus Binatia bacterium]
MPLTYVKSERGQGVVEFSLAALLFFTVLFAIVEFSHIFYVRLTVTHALREAGRYMITGRTESGMLREDAIIDVFNKLLMGTGAGLQGLPACEILVDIPPSSTGCGGPSDTVRVRATFHKPLFSAFFASLFPGGGGCPSGSVCFDLNITWVNEPFT